MKTPYCNGVTIPQRMRKLHRFQGMPIPYTTWVHPETGVPDFKINDEARRQRAIAKRLCNLCGHRMNEKIAFIGGPGSILQGQLFVDAGMHPACAAFAWDVCPYIVYGRGHAKLRNTDPRAVVVVFREIPTDAPDRMGMIITSSYEVVAQQGNVFVRAGAIESVVWRTYPHTTGAAQ